MIDREAQEFENVLVRHSRGGLYRVADEWHQQPSGWSIRMIRVTELTSGRSKSYYGQYHREDSRHWLKRLSQSFESNSFADLSTVDQAKAEARYRRM